MIVKVDKETGEPEKLLPQIATKQEAH